MMKVRNLRFIRAYLKENKSNYSMIAGLLLVLLAIYGVLYYFSLVRFPFSGESVLITGTIEVTGDSQGYGSTTQVLAITLNDGRKVIVSNSGPLYHIGDNVTLLEKKRKNDGKSEFEVKHLTN